MTINNPYRSLPSVDRLIADPRIGILESGLTAALAREVLTTARSTIARGDPPPTYEQLIEGLLGRLHIALEPPLRPVINATGVIIHTNLGRAPLSQETIEAITAASRSYSNLEFSLEDGRRGSRHVHLSELLRTLTGAENGIVVNNNASALFLTFSAIATQREVIVSRGQAVEIGGGFRIPDIIGQSGARLVEVGTTNRTYLDDYAEAIGPETAAILHVHTSNFRVIGYAQSPTITDLAKLAVERGILLLNDLGSGCLVDTTHFGMAPEPTVGASVEDGCDLTFFSGDKLLGGPQAGIIVGRRDLLEALSRHPLSRALRMDKCGIAGLAATLNHYLRGEALEKIPIWRMISTSEDVLARRAGNIAKSTGCDAYTEDGRSMIGGGSLPGESLPTMLVALPGNGTDLVGAARRLRLGQPSVVARLEGERLLFDPRTVDPQEDQALVTAVRNAF